MTPQRPVSSLEWSVFHGPLTNPTDDALHRREWTQGVANALAQWDGRESLCLNIDGEWGSGKSTAMSFVLAALASAQTRLTGATVVNAWELDSQSSSEQFLHRALRAALSSLWVRAIQTNFWNILQLTPKLISLRLSQFSLERVRDSTMATLIGVATVVATATAGLLAAIGLSSPLTVSILPTWLTVSAWRDGLVMLLAFSALIALLPLAFNVTRRILKALTQSFSDRWFRSVFAGLSGNLVVVIEDLDRVSADRLTDLFRLMQTKFRLSHVIYVLPMSRRQVNAVLRKAGVADADTYLGRVVQVALALPPISQEDIETVLNEGITAIVQHRPWERQLNPMTKRLPRSFMSYFTDLRVANRYLHALSFTASALTTKGVLEVNARDLVLVEALRLFEPWAYRMLHAHRNQFVGQHNMGLLETQRPEIGDKVLEYATNPDATRRIICSLFSVATRVFSNNVENFEIKYEPTGELKLEHSATFDRYFMHLSPETGFAIYEDLVASTRGTMAYKPYFKIELRRVLKLESSGATPAGSIEQVIDAFDSRNASMIVEGMSDLEFEGQLEPTEIRRLARLLVQFLERLPDGGVGLAIAQYGQETRLSALHARIVDQQHGLGLLTIEPWSPGNFEKYATLSRRWVDNYDANGAYSHASWHNNFSDLRKQLSMLLAHR